MNFRPLHDRVLVRRLEQEERTAGGVIIPDTAAYVFAREVPFPTLFRTLEYLDARYHPALLVVCSGLTVLAIHIVAYPWP